MVKPRDRVDELVDAGRAATPHLNDTHRARILARIEEELDADLEPASSPRPRWLLVAPIGVAAVLALFLLWPRAGDPTILRPYVYAGRSARADVLTAPQARLEVAEGDVVRAEIGGEGRLTLRGPARLAVADAEPGRVELLLEEGCLLVDWDGTRHRRLVVRSPGARTEVVGTLFAVEATDGGSIVAVARGRVTVGAIAVAAGSALRAGEAAPEPTPPRLVALMAEHEHSALPPDGDWGMLQISGDESSGSVWSGDRVLGGVPLVARVPAGRAAVRFEDEGRDGARLVAEVATGGLSVLEARRPAAPSVAAPAAAPVAAPAPAPAPTPKPAPKPAPAPPAPPVPSPGHAAPAQHDPPATHARPTAPSPTPAEPVVPTPYRVDDPAPTPSAAESLYIRAEDAMRARRPGAAREILLRLVAEMPADPLADSARYEIARLALLADDARAADEQLDWLAAHGRDPALFEPAAYLICRIALREHRQRAATCLEDYRRRFPGSTRDAEILALLAGLRAEEGCAAALPLLDEYIARYPAGRFRRDADARRARCSP